MEAEESAAEASVRAEEAVGVAASVGSEASVEAEESVAEEPVQAEESVAEEPVQVEESDGVGALDGDGSDEGWPERVAEELRDRSFRQFEPSRDANPRKAIIISFLSGFSVWAQYAEDGHALKEWEVVADEFLVVPGDSGSEVTIRFVEPRAVQLLPVKCGDCVDVSDLSVSVVNVFDADKIVFKLNDPGRRLPSPFPVFEQWTRFNEDEYFD